MRPPKPQGMVLATYIGFASLGWVMNGLGAVLPSLRDELGEWAALYSLLPGLVLVVWGSIVMSRHHVEGGGGIHRVGVGVGSLALAGSLIVMGITGFTAVSVVGAVATAISASYLIRLLPGVLATLRPDDTEQVMMRSNAYSSVSAILAPLAVGATIAIGIGWVPGFAVPVAVAAVATVWASRQRVAGERADQMAEHSDENFDDEPVPPLRDWWRACAVLSMCIVVEFCFSYFATTYLNEELGLSTAKAAAGGAAWGIGMAIGRFVVSTWPPPRTVVPSVIAIFAGFVLLWGFSNPAIAIAGIGIAGLGASPLYPSRMTVLIERFPGAPHQGSTRGSLASGIALLAAPALMVSMRAVSDVRTAYLVVPVLLVILLVLALPRQKTQVPALV